LNTSVKKLKELYIELGGAIRTEQRRTETGT
jgi:hypothetical protein